MSSSHNVRNLTLFYSIAFFLFLIGSAQILSSPRFLQFPLRGTQLIVTSAEVALVVSLVISLIAVPLGYGYMFFFGGVTSTRAIKLYLFLTRGKTVITSKATDLETIIAGRSWSLKPRRQCIYFCFILAVVVSFAFYVVRHAVFPIASPLTNPSDIIPIVTKDYITLAMEGSLMIPVVTLALPYFGGLRLRTIDVGPFHTTVLTFVVGASGGFTLLYSVLARPVITYLFNYYLPFFVGVCWCFAVGCNFAADASNRQIVRDVLAEKSTSKLVPSKIWLENPPGKFVEV